MENLNYEVILRYLDGTYNPEDEKLLLEWLKESEENAKLLLEYKKLWTLRKIAYYNKPEKLGADFYKLSSKIKENQKKARIISIRKVMRYAALIVLFVSLPAIILWLSHKETINTLNVYVSESDSSRVVTLFDGTKVWINKKSTFSHPEKFSGSERRVKIDGEAYFEVKTDSLNPFIVETQAIQIKVYGTTFDINTCDTDSTIKTILVNGRVSVLDLNGKELTMLKPGFMASYHKHNKQIKVEKTNTDYFTVWRLEKIVFKNATLNEVINKLQDVYKTKINLEPLKKNTRVNFVFNKEQSLLTVLEMLKFVTHINYEVHNNEIFITQKQISNITN